MLKRKPPPTPRREPKQMAYRPAMQPARAVMARIDQTVTPAQAVPKPARAKRGASAAEREYMGRVAAIGCLLCGSPAEVHHLREGQGMSRRASNWLTMPLCSEHHRGPRGVHGDRSALRAVKVDELDLLAMTIESLSA